MREVLDFCEATPAEQKAKSEARQKAPTAIHAYGWTVEAFLRFCGHGQKS